MTDPPTAAKGRTISVKPDAKDQRIAELEGALREAFVCLTTVFRDAGKRHGACVAKIRAILKESQAVTCSQTGDGMNQIDLIADGSGLEAWLASDDTGLSSLWMAHICAGAQAVRNEYPHDPSDFGRCYRFLRAVPHARANLHKLKDAGPVWSAYVDNWKEMEHLWEEESPQGMAPKLYSLMQKLRKESVQ